MKVLILKDKNHFKTTPMAKLWAAHIVLYGTNDGFIMTKNRLSNRLGFVTQEELPLIVEGIL